MSLLDAKVLDAARAWYEARTICISCSIQDREYRQKLNKLSEAEDELRKAVENHFDQEE